MKPLITIIKITSIILYIIFTLNFIDYVFLNKISIILNVSLFIVSATYLSAKIPYWSIKYIYDFKTVGYSLRFFTRQDTSTKFLIKTQINTFKLVTCKVQPGLQHLLNNHYYTALYFVDKNGIIFYPKDIKQLKPWDEDKMIFNFYDYE